MTGSSRTRQREAAAPTVRAWAPLALTLPPPLTHTKHRGASPRGEGGCRQPDEHEVCHQSHEQVGKHKVQLAGGSGVGGGAGRGGQSAGSARRGMVRRGAVRCSLGRAGMVRRGPVRCSLGRAGMVRRGMVRRGPVRCSLGRAGMVRRRAARARGSGAGQSDSRLGPDSVGRAVR